MIKKRGVDGRRTEKLVNIALSREEGEEPLVCLKEEDALTKLTNFLAKFNDLVSRIFMVLSI